MTETNVCSDNADLGRPRFWSLPPVAFFAALAAAPICVALGGVFAAIPSAPTAFLGLAFIVSAILGAPSYLLVFAPMAWISHLKRRRGWAHFTWLAFLANLIACAGAVCLVLVLSRDLSDLEDAAGFLLFVHGFGLIFAPIYGAIFGAVFLALMNRGAPEARADQNPEALS